jgi:acyl-coenzyme A thioesterase PaaI-like protein
VLAALLDEIGAWAVMVKLETAGVTQEMTVRYHKTAFAHQGALTLRAGVAKRDGNLTTVHGRIFDAGGTMTTDADLRYFLFPEHIAKKRLSYPGVEAFLPE